MLTDGRTDERTEIWTPISHPAISRCDKKETQLDKSKSSQRSSNLSFQPMKISVCYWKEKVPGQFSPSTFPCFLQYDKVKGQTFVVYGLPSLEYPGLVKVSNPYFDYCVSNKWTCSNFCSLEVFISLFLFITKTRPCNIQRFLCCKN